MAAGRIASSSCAQAFIYCRDQMLAVVVVIQHRVSSPKTVRPAIPRDAPCIGHDEMTWSAVSSVVPLSRFDEGARPHLYMDE